MLGAHLLGVNAEELINLFAVAVQHGLTVSDLRAVEWTSFTRPAWTSRAWCRGSTTLGLGSVAPREGAPQEIVRWDAAGPGGREVGASAEAVVGAPLDLRLHVMAAHAHTWGADETQGFGGFLGVDDRFDEVHPGPEFRCHAAYGVPRALPAAPTEVWRTSTGIRPRALLWGSLGDIGSGLAHRRTRLAPALGRQRTGAVLDQGDDEPLTPRVQHGGQHAHVLGQPANHRRVMPLDRRWWARPVSSNAEF